MSIKGQMSDYGHVLNYLTSSGTSPVFIVVIHSITVPGFIPALTDFKTTKGDLWPSCFSSLRFSPQLWVQNSDAK